MKRLAIHHTAMPNEGDWMPKPPVKHFRFLDWATLFQEWQLYIKSTSYKYRNEPKTN